MLNLPTLSTSHFINSHFVNSHFVNIDQMGIDKVAIDKVGIDKVGTDKVGIDEVGITLFNMHAVTQFHFHTVTVSAESVGGSTPGVRVTWNTTLPPECVTSVRVEFRTSSRGPVVATYTTTNTSQTEVIQTGLQCSTNYYTRVAVTGGTSDGVRPTVSSRQVQVLAGGNSLCLWLPCASGSTYMHVGHARVEFLIPEIIELTRGGRALLLL